MPKVNVYLPEDLAAAVREAGVPLSAVCQRALADAVAGVTRARQSVAAIRDPAVDLAGRSALRDGLARRMTPRLREAFALAQRADPAGRVGPRELLLGLLDVQTNLGLALLVANGVDPDDLREAAAALPATEDERAGAPDAWGEAAREGESWVGLSFEGRLVLASTIEAAIDLAHNYLGCEHLVVGLIESGGERVAALFEARGLSPEWARRAVASATTGFARARAVDPTAESGRLAEVLRRIEALEHRLDQRP